VLAYTHCNPQGTDSPHSFLNLEGEESLKISGNYPNFLSITCLLSLELKRINDSWLGRLTRVALECRTAYYDHVAAAWHSQLLSLVRLYSGAVWIQTQLYFLIFSSHFTLAVMAGNTC